MLQQLLNFIVPFPPLAGYFIVFIILIGCGIGIPIPEDITLFVGGMLSYSGQTNVWIMMSVCIIGVLLGDGIIFLAGAKYGRSLLKKTFFAKVLHEERLDDIRNKLKVRGNSLIFMARFMPGLRAPIYFTAGTLHLPFRIFLFYDGLATLISVPAIVYGAYYLGDKFEVLFKWVRKFEYGIIVLFFTILIIFFIHYVIVKRKQKSLS